MALEALVKAYNAGSIDAAAALKLAKTPGYSMKLVWPVQPKIDAYSGADRSSMYDLLTRNGSLFWYAACPFLNVPARYNALMGPGSQLSIVLINFGIGVNIEGYNELRDEEKRGAQERVQPFNAYNQKVGYNFLSRGRKGGFYTSVNIG